MKKLVGFIVFSMIGLASFAEDVQQPVQCVTETRSATSSDGFTASASCTKCSSDPNLASVAAGVCARSQATAKANECCYAQN